MKPKYPLHGWEPVPHERRVLLATVVVVFGYLVVSAFEPIRLNWGDPWSDANVLTALNYSSKYGFLATSFTDILDVGPLTAESYRYTHYPPFAEIFYGVVTKIAGGKPLDITVYRLFGIGFAAIGLHAFHRYVTAVWGRSLASWATVVCATNLLWVQFADSMHQSPILFASGMTALAAVPAWVKRTRFALAAVVVGTYVCFLTAYDYYVFLPATALLTARLLGVPLLSRRLFALAGIVAASGALAIATKSAFVTGALGWHGFLEDVHFQFLERATTKFSPDYRSGFLIIIFTRWIAYFTPVAFIAAALLLANVVLAARRFGLFASARSLLFGRDELREHPGSILVLLVAGLPFILVFSELSVEQVLPSQVMLPFCAVASAYFLRWLVAARAPRVGYAVLGAVVLWQLVHLVRIPKAFLERDVSTAIRDYLKKSDSADFVLTNVMDDGIAQYYFDRHLHPPTDKVEQAKAGYAELATKTPGGVIHAVHFEDPNGRVVDKALWSLLPQKHQWAVFGTPYVLRERALKAVAEYDEKVLEGLRQSGEEVLHFPGIRVFRIGESSASRRAQAVAQLAAPTRLVDFGTKAAEPHKLTGFRFAENYPGVPGFCWTVSRTLQRTVLTKRGLTYRPNLPVVNRSILLVRFEQKQDERVTLLSWAAIHDQTLTASIDGETVLPTFEFGPAQTRKEVSFIVSKHLQQGDPVKEIVFEFRDVADYGGGVSFAILRVEPIEPVP